MTITRAKKSPATGPRAKRTEVSPEQFIEGAETSSKTSADASAAAGREQRALALVEGYLPWSAGAGVVPLPGIDIALIIGIQLRMLAKLADLYGVPFREEAAKSIAATLMATVVQNTLFGSLVYPIKLTPVLGPLLGIALLPAIAAAGTFALGKVFITHFEAGGTFLEFDPKKVREHFRVEFDKARAGGR